MRWPSQLCDEAGTHLRTETLSCLTSNTSGPHAADCTGAVRVFDWILGETIQTDPRTQGSTLKRPLGPWDELVHHRGYTGSFVEFLEPGAYPRLIDVRSAQDYGEVGKSVLQGLEFQPFLASDARGSDRKGATGVGG